MRAGTLLQQDLSFQSHNDVFDLTVSGDKEIRTLDPLLARQVLSQLSYIPIFCFLLFWIFYLSSGLKWTFAPQQKLIPNGLKWTFAPL